MSSERNVFFANTNHNADCVLEHIAAVQSEPGLRWFVVNSLTNRMAHEIDLNFLMPLGFTTQFTRMKNITLQELRKRIGDFKGVVFQFLQDEYQNVHLASNAMAEIGTNLLFTIVRPEYHHLPMIILH